MAKTLTITNNTTHVFTLDSGLILMPGANALSAAQSAKWEQLGAEKRKDLSHYLDNKMLVVKESEVDASESLSGLKAVEAIALVGRTNDKARLKLWLESETREPVKRALTGQIGVIDAQRDEGKGQ